MASTFSKLKNIIKKKLSEKGDFTALNNGRGFLWVGTNDKKIGTNECHYEVCSDNKRGHLKNRAYIELHCEGKRYESFKTLAQIDGVKEFEWNKYGVRLDDNGFEITDDDLEALADKTVAEIYRLDEAIGEKTRLIVDSLNAVQYWLLVANPEQDEQEHFEFQNGLKIGDEMDWVAKSGKKYKPNYQYTKVGDKIIGYNKTDNPGAIAVLTVTKPTNGCLHIRKVGEAITPVSMECMQNDDVTKEIEFLNFSPSQLQHPALSHLTEKQYSKIIEMMGEMKTESTAKNYPLNQILFGPPGTGKTYHTIDKAVEIIDGTNQTHDEAKKRFEQLKAEGRIMFTTFHQSMGYEDFIEGIKPKTEKGNITYVEEAGILKRACDEDIFNSLVEYQETHKTTEGTINISDLYEKFIEEIDQKIQNGESVEFTSSRKKIKKVYEVDDNGDIHFFSPDGSRDADNPVNGSKLLDIYNDYPEGINGNIFKTVRGYVGGNSTFYDVILTEFVKYVNKYKNSNKDDQNKDENKVDVKISVQNLDKKEILVNVYENKLKEYGVDNISDILTSPYVLIIDEINRGNVANIFGELITLIEEDKRLGNEEAMTCTLPYSKSKFGVPKNLYIIGTMNTADRSVEALDTALRRRFTFEEMMPNPELLKSTDDGVDLRKMLTVINQRICLLKDREHQIGHSYFMKVKNKEQLVDVIYKNVIPLLQEYFYGDYEKIQMVLGTGFITKDKETLGVSFAKSSSNYDKPDSIYRIVPKGEVNIDDALENGRFFKVGNTDQESDESELEEDE